MGRPGIAMTFVTDQELGVLKSLFKMNRINPVWHGSIPDLQAASKPNGRQGGKKYFKKTVSANAPKASPIVWQE